MPAVLLIDSSGPRFGFEPDRNWSGVAHGQEGGEEGRDAVVAVDEQLLAGAVGAADVHRDHGALEELGVVALAAGEDAGAGAANPGVGALEGGRDQRRAFGEELLDCDFTRPHAVVLVAARRRGQAPM